MPYVLFYLGAVAAANLVVSWAGPTWSPVTAFVFIGATLTTRDVLHDRWEGSYLPARMTVLVLAGGILSWVLNPASFSVALGSTVAFIASELVDAVFYHELRESSWLERANGSNIASAAVDSVLFPLIAFASFPLWVIGAQFLAKVGGGFIWSLVVRNHRRWGWSAATVVFFVVGLVLVLAGTPR